MVSQNLVNIGTGNAKPLPQAMLSYCKLDPTEQRLMKLGSNQNNFRGNWL